MGKVTPNGNPPAVAFQPEVHLYAEDSFFTLTSWGQGGLLLLSGFLAAFSMGLAVRLRRLRRMPAGILACALFTAFVWLSPQVYYTYYLFLFEGLPVQWVARFPSIRHLSELLSFTAYPSLSAHSQGILGWSILLSALLLPRRNAAN